MTQFVAAASDIVARLQHLDLEGTLTNLNRLLITTNNRIEAVDTAKLSQDTTRVLDKLDKLRPSSRSARTPRGCWRS